MTRSYVAIRVGQGNLVHAATVDENGKFIAAAQGAWCGSGRRHSSRSSNVSRLGTQVEITCKTCIEKIEEGEHQRFVPAHLIR